MALPDLISEWGQERGLAKNLAQTWAKNQLELQNAAQLAGANPLANQKFTHQGKDYGWANITDPTGVKRNIAVEWGSVAGTGIPPQGVQKTTFSQQSIPPSPSDVAWQQLGFTGNTGRSTGPHLDLRGKIFDDKGSYRRWTPEELKAVQGIQVGGKNPFDWKVTSPYGQRTLFGKTKLHPAFDLGTPVGTPITFDPNLWEVGQTLSPEESRGGGWTFSLKSKSDPNRLLQFLHGQAPTG